MSVIVHHEDIVAAPLDLETTVHAAKAPDTLPDLLHRNIQPDADCDGRGCVQHIVFAHGANLELA